MRDVDEGRASRRGRDGESREAGRATPRAATGASGERGRDRSATGAAPSGVARLVAMAALASTTLASSASAGDAIYAKVFPFAFASEAAAVEGCRGLTDADQIAPASKGALVYLRSGSGARLVPHSGVAALAYAVRDPGDYAYPAWAKVERRSGDKFAVVAGRVGQPGRGGVRCWYWGKAGGLRLVSVEIVIERPTPGGEVRRDAN